MNAMHFARINKIDCTVACLKGFAFTMQSFLKNDYIARGTCRGTTENAGLCTLHTMNSL